MSPQKNLLAIIVLTLAVAAISVSSVPLDSPIGGTYKAANKSHHMIIGSRLPGDRLVLRENIVKNSSWMRIVTVQKTFNASRFDRITQVAAYDQKTNGNGAYASVLNGGPGHNNVTMKFKSQRGHGINFVVELYARP